jgi:hypothetical protein
LQKVTAFLPNLHGAVSQKCFFWHVNCTHKFMARKLNVPKIPRHNNGASQTLNRRSAPPVAALYLMRLRAQAAPEVKNSSEPRRLQVEIEAENATEAPEPVKIIKID